MFEGFSTLLTTAIFLQYLSRFLNAPVRYPKLGNWLKMVWPAFGILVGILTLAKSHALGELGVWLICSASVGYSLWLTRNYRPARSLATAVSPFLGIGLVYAIIKVVSENFAEATEDYFGTGQLFAVFWFVAFLNIAIRQKKALQVEEEERAREAEERRKIEAKKQELEYLVAERTAEITSQKETLEQALAELKATQNQLIHSEKMASLGELTAGIAHEIQNPLNFVNNFADVSVELIAELEEERSKTNEERDGELEADLLADLKQNLQKITHHGSRASSIVKGMLQHSRAGSGQREPTDLNALADEYLRLAYHGLRAKDKSFNAQFSIDADPSLGPITVVPQDIGRVLLNLFTNAFYAVRERQKNQPASGSYQPRVSVSTRCQDGQAIIWVADNGTGIPESAIQKIFQPFFTTKPTGEGTGLGLSLAYDIITKGHNGTLTVSSEENKGTTFTISLPA